MWLQIEIPRLVSCFLAQASREKAWPQFDGLLKTVAIFQANGDMEMAFTRFP